MMEGVCFLIPVRGLSSPDTGKDDDDDDNSDKFLYDNCSFFTNIMPCLIKLCKYSYV
jgi:hypothetical protein